MKVILKSDVAKIGSAGDIKEVARGFARNFLFARNLAVEATPSAMKWFEKTKESREKARAKSLEEAKVTAEKLADVKLSFTRSVGESGQLFGSVGKADIVKSLKASGYVIGRDQVLIDSAIKEIGESEVDVRLAPDVQAKIKVTIIARR